MYGERVGKATEREVISMADIWWPGPLARATGVAWATVEWLGRQSLGRSSADSEGLGGRGEGMLPQPQNVGNGQFIA